MIRVSIRPMITHCDAPHREWLIARLEQDSCPEPMSGCTLWYGASDGRERYGHLLVQGKNWKAHRLAWTVANGQIPPGKHVLHKCDVPWCINVDHLYIGTPLDNARDCVSRGRARKATGDAHFARQRPWLLARGDRNGMRTHPGIVQGELNPRAKLTALDVADARRRYATGCVTLRALALEHGVARSVMMSAVRGITWKSVTDPPPVPV